ncbi:MAG: LpqB family beta-propeller domain-containing protein [Propionibacteriaceae bacterium]|jgi:hypothetical protein|nr:LpqB family beta-propeller domain-containing protein [Propionibacteriaceae bacterium]
MKGWRILALGLALTLTAGCAGLPLTGPVLSQPREVDDEQGSVTVEPQPPPIGALPEMIIRGFLVAMASYELDYATARLYLTDAAAQQWNPRSGALIYASGSTPSVALSTNGAHVVMRGQQIGQIEADGSFTVPEEGDWEHDFEMIKEDGEWRISSPPKGLVMSQFSFSQSFEPVDAYFFAATGRNLVPDARYLPRGAWSRTMAASIVLEGPSAWLSRIIRPAPKPHFSLDQEVGLTSDGVAEVGLPIAAKELTPQARTDLAIEIAATMRGLPGVRAVRLLCEGEVLPLTTGPANILSISETERFDPARNTANPSLMWIQDNLVTTSVADTTVNIEGEWGRTPHPSRHLAAKQTQIAVVTPEGLLTGPRTDELPLIRWEAPDLLRPQFSRGNLWVMSATGAIKVILAKSDTVVDLGHTQVAALNSLRPGERTLQGFQISPDGQRILLITSVDQAGEEPRQELSLALITYDEQGVPVEIRSDRPIRLTWQGETINSIVDVAWSGPCSLLVLGGSGKNPTKLFDTDLDGIKIRDRSHPQLVRPVQMAVHTNLTGPQIAILGDDQVVWAYQEGYRWVQVATGATAIAYPALQG